MSTEIQKLDHGSIPSLNEIFTNKDAFEQAQRVCMLLSKSDLVPARYKNNVQNTMIALEMANRIGANALFVMQNLYVVHGTPAWSGQFVISAINSCKRFYPLEFEITGSGDSLACYAFAEDKRTGRIRKGTLITYSMAKQEGWIDKTGSKWKTMPEQMIMYRAASFFGRIYCPDVLMGMYTVEEVEEYTPMSDMNLDEYLENLLRKSTYDPEQREIIADKIQGGLSREEAIILAKDLEENQLDPVTQGAHYGVTDAKNAVQNALFDDKK